VVLYFAASKNNYGPPAVVGGTKDECSSGNVPTSTGVDSEVSLLTAIDGPAPKPLSKIRSSGVPQTSGAANARVDAKKMRQIVQRAVLPEIQFID
jgi:hypothetical protein